MAARRCVKLVLEIRGNYGYGHGYETVNAETSWPAARRSIREYRENEPGTPFKIVRKYEPCTKKEKMARRAKKGRKR
jgi:hypothetical protein